MVSYADFITLLFAFFTTMYAMSRVDAEKFTSVAAGMHEAFAAPSTSSSARPATRHSGTGPSVGRPAVLPRAGGRDERLELIQHDLSARLARERSRGTVDLSRDRRGLVISIREAGVFELGHARVMPPLRSVLHEVAVSLAPVGNSVRVEGHTDDRPIANARFASNWELSTARATSVVAVFVDEEGIDPRRLSAAGYAEHHPREPNNTEARRAGNRRVDIVVLSPATEAAEEPSTGREPGTGS